MVADVGFLKRYELKAKRTAVKKLETVSDTLTSSFCNNLNFRKLFYNSAGHSFSIKKIKA
jgi:hypothetical protein